nr:accessory gland protein Acp29AB-like [Drosophila takahashii]
MNKLTAILVIVLVTGSLGEPTKIRNPGSQSIDLEVSCIPHFFTNLRPVMDYIAVNQNRWETCEATKANDTQIQLASLQESVTNVTSCLEAKDGRLERMEESLKKLISHVSEERLSRFENKQSALESKLMSLDGQLTDIMHSLSLSMSFQKVNSRYFYFNRDIEKSWRDAEFFCVEKGGHLATFQNEAELMAISAKVNPDVRYWLGVNDRAKKGNFVYLDTGRKVSYLKWSPGEPDYWNDRQHCVVFYQGAMRVNECDNENPVICQIGNDI